MISYWHHTVICPSVCDIVHCSAQGKSTGSWKLYHHVHKTAVPIQFSRTFAEGCIKYHSSTMHSTHTKKPHHQNSHIWNSHGQHGHVTMPFPDVAFSAVWYCSYTVCRTQYRYYRPSEQRLCSLLEPAMTHTLLTSLMFHITLQLHLSNVVVPAAKYYTTVVISIHIYLHLSFCRLFVWATLAEWNWLTDWCFLFPKKCRN